MGCDTTNYVTAHFKLLIYTFCRRYIIADTEVTTLKDSVKLGQRVNLLLVQVKDAAVVLPHALYQWCGDETPTD